MTKKKDFLADFEFKKLDNLSQGLEIPISNPLKTTKIDLSGSNSIKASPIPLIELKSNNEPKNGKEINIPEFDYKNKNIEPLINVVPTSKKEIKVKIIKTQKSIDLGFDKEEFGAIPTKIEKVMFLAMRGWSLKVEQRRNALFHYATKYIARKKRRIYLGSVNSSNQSL
jgi:hypothetical protein